MKRLLAAVLAVCMISGIVGCGKKPETGNASEASSTTAEKESAETTEKEESIEKMVWKLGDTQAEDHPEVVSFGQFGEKLEHLTNGQIQVEIYPNSALGNHREMLESVQMGNLEITKCMSTDLSFYVEESAIFGLPYIFTSLEHMDACLIGGLKDWFNNLLAEKDLVVIAWLDAGSRSVYNSKNAINKMEDMNGLLLRVPENDVFLSSMAAFGATGTPMPMGDIYSALQTGVIDGAENAAPVLYSMKHYEVAKYFSLTEHIRTPDVLIMSKSYLESLPKEIQDAVWEAGAYLEEVERQNWADYNDKCLEELEMGGTVINEVADKSDFVKASETVWEKFKDVVGEDMIDLCVSLQ